MADVPNNVQQSGIEIASTFGAATFGATGTGVTAAGILIKGWVFFICTEPETLGGSRRTGMRVVSFFGPGETNSVSVAGMPAAKGAEGANEGRGGEVADDEEIGGGKNVGAETGLGEADGCEIGGRGELGGVGRGAGGGAAAASAGLPVTLGGSVKRTVSFFGSFGSAIGGSQVELERCRKTRNLSLANFASGRN